MRQINSDDVNIQNVAQFNTNYQEQYIDIHNS